MWKAIWETKNTARACPMESRDMGQNIRSNDNNAPLKFWKSPVNGVLGHLLMDNFKKVLIYFYGKYKNLSKKLFIFFFSHKKFLKI